MENNQIKKLTEIAKLVMEQYKKDYPEVTFDRDYLPFKISEEWGECLQAYLMLTGRGRHKDKTEDERKDLLSQELADTFAFLLLFAENEGIDLEDAMKEKWLPYLENK